MNISLRYSILASLYCFTLVLVREDRCLPVGFLGTMRRVRFVPLYVISLGNLEDSPTLWHEVLHIRVIEWAQNSAQQDEVIELRKACRNVVNDEPELSFVLREFYDLALNIDGRDEAVVLTLERPNLRACLTADHIARLHSIERAPLLDIRTSWFQWLVIVSALLKLIQSIKEFVY